ncbi:GNAT family acetyltransferase [Dyella japonica A8]|uniref:GNAT family acetyltransferase n=1 Tax=Dyella japonica A8 TaxID=1217721 RepID=A0A075JZF4_9GAMM|nr:GNAT family acetyltransferase [Dyella japonica A8]
MEEEHLDALFDVGRDRDIWRLTSVDYSDPAIFYQSFKTALQDRALGKAYPFLVCLRGSGRIIGTTRILDIHPDDKKVEIGVTWIASEFWGTGINMECKQLLLTFCFDTLGVGRVQFRAKADNARSRRALEKVGATFEGILRRDKIEPNGKPRNTAFYSIVSDEWPSVKSHLASQLATPR